VPPRQGSGDAFPFEAVRDLLGVVRAMYAAAKSAGAGRAELTRIAKIGGELSQAIDLAADTRPGTIGHAAAWRRAEEATRRVADLVDSLTPAEPMVSAARARVSGTRVTLRRRLPER
jgi:hypothetical protein